jgi:hypothetical protein
MRLAVTTFAAFLIAAPIAEAASNDIFMVRTTSRSPDTIVAAIKDYAQTMEWQYLSDNKVKKGEVTLVKICIPEVGRIIWPLGLQLSAMLPCGNIGIYTTDSGTEISVLHPRYLNILYPDPEAERAGEVGAPLLTEMLDSVAGD